MFNKMLCAHLTLAPVLLVIGIAAGQDAIRLNQIGFYPTGPKFAVAVGAAGGRFYVLTRDQGDTLLAGTLGTPRLWPHSGESVQLIDFTSLQQPGEYLIVVPGLGSSPPFTIGNHVHQTVTVMALKSYYFQRASTPLLEPFAGKWRRPAGHPDTQVWVHPSAASAARPVNTILSSARGWYDAGDYNKYIVNSGISTYTLLAAYEHFPAYFRALAVNIPESANRLPDILDEALWNLAWMLTMQDPNDGGVYHKLTTANFSGFVMPHQDTARRYVVQKSTAATLDFAAVMAQASRIFADFSAEMPGFAQTCLQAGLAAWRWARRNPNVRYDQHALNAAYDPDITTGEYGDGSTMDELRWAAAELFITTQADSFLAAANPLAGPFGVPAWPNVNTLGIYSLAFHRARVGAALDTNAVKAILLHLAGSLRAAANASAYRVAMGISNSDFVWGSNGIAANQGMALVQACRLTGDVSFLEAAVHHLDYLLGRNATGYCFMTGAGEKSPRHPHHRPSQADGIAEPVPGLLVGGPNGNARNDDGGSCPAYLGPERARMYLDNVCSYATNENAINWNAPLVYLAGAIEALYSPTGRPNPTTVSEPREGASPRAFGLLPNYPNPFNPSTQIRYALPVAGWVEFGIYNATGQLIRRLQQATLPAGYHTVRWNADTDSGHRVASGIYFACLRFQASGRVWHDLMKMLLLR
ncbi:MAG: glycoside hydrolase family 9 protein [candidate division KSB1 bacterium]|nr:glycoside hydrolase family 9 protein [candidate division KSB1 bacterium]MDZ7276388.1 glycoside hydrolase family 9 protein [candidate division KSB1 bacterium]MDZ7287660.1 glycoside hydrolase family 9 protein [candidate division KSB1 bacterium]MDZ7300000.1 glycoside hydrolase family 9 protein [candidate division KSB1 bacterium]MDZ7309198.1 glycoside hydrolase family 9 protein [candidate division KSB1 bacterium]